MVTNVLSVRSIEAGALDMHVAPFDPRAAVAELLQVCRFGAGCTAAGELAWTNERAPLPARVEGDRAFFSQILQNLVRARARACVDASLRLRMCRIVCGSIDRIFV
jgi:signal transduction histidine kinase